MTVENKIEAEFIFCTACEECTSDAPNLIYICDLCSTPVHRDCYKSDLETIDEKEFWFCAACQELLKNDQIETPCCFLCPETNMIMKQYASSTG